MSDDTVVVGDEDGGANSGGSVYVFVKPAGGWTNMSETAQLTSTDGQSDDLLGYSVSLSGDTVVAGAEKPRGMGAAYVFVKPAGGWANMTQTAELTPSQPDLGFGYAVSIRNDTIVAGSPFANVGSHDGQGAAYVFVRPASGWTNMTETAKLTAFNGRKNDNLGWAVAVSPTRIVAAAVLAGAGSVYVFHKPFHGWATTSRFNAKLHVGCYSVAIRDQPPTVVSGDRVFAAFVFGWSR